MNIRFQNSPAETKAMTTEQIRENFLVQNLMQDDAIELVYSHYDRVIIGGVKPVKKTIELPTHNELKADYPEFESAITAIQARIVDLMVPFRKKYYYLNAMQNSYSLKLVLPALVPELSYDEMIIADGGNASTAFYNLRFENDEAKIKETRQALLEYCKLDTLGMVRVLEKLRLV